MRLIDVDKLIYQSHAQHIQPYINKKDIDNAPTVEIAEDCISRQALIEKATSWDKHFADSERCVSLTDIQNAPPVTPKQPFINKPCISEGICHEDKVNVLEKIRAEILDEAEYAYADFDEYKEDILHAEADELPDDDFRYGLERAIEIINKYKAESEEMR